MMKAQGSWTLARCITALFFCLGWTAHAQVPPVRIMAVGDSITDGTAFSAPAYGGPGGGYRLPLWQRLTNAGYVVDYVGLQTTNPSGELPDSHHEGHGGWKIDQIYSNMVNLVFGSVEDPDVLLLMIGTNDFGGNYDVNNATNRLDQLVGLLTTRWPHCKVVVASLTRRGEPLNTNIQTNFNNSVPVIVAQHAANGEQVYFTDMYSAVPLSDMPDSLHPSTNGYVKMATNWFPAVTNVISPLGTTNAPGLVRVSQVSGLSNVTVTFSKPVSDATATDLANYFVDGGLTVLEASLEPVAKRAVTLTTTPMALHTNYLLVVQNVADRTPAATVMEPAVTSIVTFGASQRGVFNNVPEAGDYRLVYSLNIPNSPNYAAGIVYDTDLRAYASNFTRVAYYLELQPSNGPLDFVWTSFDAMTTNVNQIGVPTLGSGGNFQMIVTNLNVLSSGPSIVNGTNLATGNIEFWPSNYAGANAAGIPNASGSSYDWGDQQTGGNYGCMQVHNHGASQVLFAFNHWNGGPAELGIGNGPTNADWTFSNNGPTYTVRTLQVFARLASNVTPVVTSSFGGGYSNAVLQFSLPVADDATNVGWYALSGGLSVLNAALDPLTRQTLTLTTSAQSPGVTYTAVVNNVHDRSTSNSLVIATNTLATFLGPAVNGVFGNVAEVTNYTLVYSLNISNAAAYNAGGVPYDVAVPQHVGAFTRVAYYLELQSATGLPSYIWVALDPFTTNASRLGVPAGAASPIFQQLVTNMTVRSSVAGIVQGTGLATGNIEFWPWDYQQGNSNNVPNASGAVFDWGDRVVSNTGGHGSMQIHNHGASQVLFAFNNWGAAAGGTTALGIGNRPGSTDPDWTFAANTPGYTVKTLQVFALPVSNAAPVIAGVSAPSLSNVVIVFSKMLEASSVAATNFTIPGVTVLGATLDPVSLARVTLVTTPLTPLTTYTSVVSHVRDRSPGALMIAPGSAMAFTTPATTGAYANVPEAVNYTLIHSIDLPVAASYPYAAVYDTDLRSFVTNFTRVAYYLELQTNGGTPNFAWTSFDAPTNNLNALGIPTLASGAIFQQPITNLNVVCSVTSVVTGTGLAGGNIEFWPGNYASSNAMNVANATHTNYDFGDVRTAGNYGSMQVHNHDADLGTRTGQVIFAFNKWGGTSTTTDDIGIGNRPGSTDLDWTFAGNANAFILRRLQVYVLADTNLPPVVVNAVGLPGLSNVVLSFSDQLADTSLTLTNFSIGGLTVLGASLDAATKTRITLTTSPQTPRTHYTVTMNGIADRSPAALPLAANTAATFMSEPFRGALNNVPEAAHYTLVYHLNIPNSTNFNTTGPSYALDNRFAITGISRIAYYVELQASNGAPNFLWASMDAFTSDPGRIGVPHASSGAFFQQPVTNLTVQSSAYGVTSGANMAGGNLEFWTNASAAANSAGVPNASGATLDWGDQPVAGAYGSMQIHNGGAGQVLFAMNNWGGGAGNLDLALGGNFATTNSDWTAMYNAGIYTSKILQVYVLPLPDATAPTIVSAVASPDRKRVVVTFSEPLADSSASAANFSIDNGIAVTAAVLGGDLRQITLSVSQLAGGAVYTLTVNDVRDRSASANPIAPNSTAVITPAALPPQVLANAPEAADYQLVYTLAIPNTATNWNAIGTPYATDHRHTIGLFSRVAYYLELATNNGPTNWVWVSMDAFTNDVNKIGVPDLARAGGPIIQQRLTNLTVLSSVASVAPGTNLTTGNIEFWPHNYGGANTLGIPGASGTALDFGDQVSPVGVFGAGGHGSMQIHNWGATQTVFALNRWGNNGNVIELGIGNDPGVSRANYNPDWTHGTNAPNYVLKNLHVLVRPVIDPNGPLVARVQATPDLAGVLVTCNQPLDDASASPTNFIIPGLTVTAAALLPNLHDILLGTSPQSPGANYVMAVSNLRDRTTNSTVMAAPVGTNFTSYSTGGINALVPETTNLALVYGLSLPASVPNYNTNGINYDVDLRPLITQNINRVAYFLELATNAGPTSWVYVAAAPFSTNLNRIGVPVLGTGAGFQQKLATNATVYSSEPGITTGTNLNTLSMEFWPYNYSAATTAVVTGGSGTNYDWNDTYSLNSGQYGSMQIHNYAAGNVLFAFNHWGAGQSGFTDVGIGAQPVGHLDWTQTQGANNYATRNLYVFVRLTNAPAAAAPAAVAPVFVTHPASRTNVQNSAAILAGLAGGSSPIRYQWRKNGSPLAGETNSWLAIASVQFADAGSYGLLASNSAGVATSLVAVLSVTNPPPSGGYDAWAAQITNGLTNDTDSALGDGYPNLLKYATGSNPTNADGRAHLFGTRTNGMLALRFNHDTNATDITIIVEGADAATNNAAWLGIATNLGGSWGGATNVAENTATQPASVTVQDTRAAPTNRFLRLRVTRP